MPVPVVPVCLPGLGAVIPAIRHLKRHRIFARSQKPLHGIGLIIQNLLVYRMLWSKFPVIRANVIDICVINTIGRGIQPRPLDVSGNCECLLKPYASSGIPKRRLRDTRRRNRAFHPGRRPFFYCGFKGCPFCCRVAVVIPYRDEPLVLFSGIQTRFARHKALLGGFSFSAVIHKCAITFDPELPGPLICIRPHAFHDPGKIYITADAHRIFPVARAKSVQMHSISSLGADRADFLNCFLEAFDWLAEQSCTEF